MHARFFTLAAFSRRLALLACASRGAGKLHPACLEGRRKILEQLVSLRVNLCAADGEGKTALAIATERAPKDCPMTVEDGCRLEVSQLLLAAHSEGGDGRNAAAKAAA